MHYASDMLPGGKQLLADLPAVQKFHGLVSESFRIIANNIESKKTIKTQITIPSLQLIKNAVNGIRAETPTEDLLYMDGFLFCAEIMVIQLTELIILIGRKFPVDEEASPLK
jgi:hypothetical protein